MGRRPGSWASIPVRILLRELQSCEERGRRGEGRGRREEADFKQLSLSLPPSLSLSLSLSLLVLLPREARTRSLFDFKTSRESCLIPTPRPQARNSNPEP